jgi:rhodanese-related sulfurtransferase
VALFLKSKGYRAKALRGGFNAWRDADYPLDQPELAEQHR